MGPPQVHPSCHWQCMPHPTHACNSSHRLQGSRIEHSDSSACAHMASPMAAHQMTCPNADSVQGSLTARPFPFLFNLAPPRMRCCVQIIAGHAVYTGVVGTLALVVGHSVFHQNMLSMFQWTDGADFVMAAKLMVPLMVTGVRRIHPLTCHHATMPPWHTTASPHARCAAKHSSTPRRHTAPHQLNTSQHNTTPPRTNRTQHSTAQHVQSRPRRSAHPSPPPPPVAALPTAVPHLFVVC